MAIRYATAAKQAGVAAIVARANGGTLRIREGTTVRVDIPLEAVAFDVTDGVATARGEDGANPIGVGNPLSATASAVGAWDNYQVLNSSDGLEWDDQDGSELTLSTVGDTVTITAWTHTIPDPVPA